jgi:AmmeMemoRadiSam system protein A
MPLTEVQRSELLSVARESIEFGLSHLGAPEVDARCRPPLDQPGASFVTLHRHGRLRGCIGSLEARRPLLVDVAENAYAAAFRDPRFPPLQAGELDGLAVDVSVLSEPDAMRFGSQADLLAQIRPGIDGLILEDRGRRGTFLPSVWESLTTADLFLQQLRVKAGLPPDHWSDTLRVWRYTTESFGDSDRG